MLLSCLGVECGTLVAMASMGFVTGCAEPSMPIIRTCDARVAHVVSTRGVDTWRASTALDVLRHV